MPGLLKIEDTRTYQDDSGRAVCCLGFDIRDLLRLIPADGKALSWSIFPMGGEPTEVTGDLSTVGLTAERLEEQVESSPTGMVVTWERLLNVAEAVDQTIWGVYLACRDAAAFEQLVALPVEQRQFMDTASSAFYEQVEIGFQAIDSSYWLAYARDDAIVTRIRQTFSDVTMVVLR